MQEDKISKLIAQKLKQVQENEPQPYDLGAWENFQEKRKAKSSPLNTWWLSGIAASILIGAIGFSVYFSASSPVEQVSDQVLSTNSFSPDRSEKSLIDSAKETPSAGNQAEKQFLSPSEETDFVPRQELIEEHSLAQHSEAKANKRKSESKKSNLIAKVESVSPVEKLDKSGSRSLEEVLLFSSKDLLSNYNFSTGVPSRILADQNKTVVPSNEESDFEFPPILAEKSKLTLGLGLSPGFGASEQNGNASVNSSLGMGFLVAMDLPGKLTVGSGLGINVFNQENQLQSPPNVAFASSMSPVQEQLLVRQTQLDIPVYFQYPITTSESISLQAGFSNFIALSQVSELESSFTRQVPVSGQDALLSNSFQLRSESVVQTQQLASPPDGKFYPLATMNFGVNLRVMQSNKTSYILMPFYHLPVNQFTGFGDNPSFYGASFKVRFGGKKD
ncbi:hypothetical protein [Algoriphagus sp.]|uniref:hypothetical protein n=1 Tax=Algoriphagus sp. TaxID=1872435 RepID=UPI00261BE1AE|nr:hypothetical protein [Algoriphagus sp.]